MSNWSTKTTGNRACWETSIYRDGRLVRTVYTYGGTRRQAEREAGVEMRALALEEQR